MTDMTAGAAPAKSSLLAQDVRTKRRNAAEARFKLYGMIAIGISVVALLFLLVSILINGSGAFYQTYLTLDVELLEEKLDKTGNRDPEEMAKVSTFGYTPLIKAALEKTIADNGIEIEGLSKPETIVSKEAAAQMRNFVLANPEVVGQTRSFEVLASGRIDGYYKGRVTLQTAERDSNISPEQLLLADALKETGALETRWNWNFIGWPDASENRPEAAGLGVAILGSFYMMIVVLALSLPIGVAASIYLEEFAPKNRWTDLIEVNISNLAAGALHRLRYPWPCDLHQLCRPATIGPGGRRPCPDPDDPAHDHHRDPRLAESRSALDPRSRAWGRGLENADRVPPRPAAGRARHPDRHDHRSRTSPWRNSPAFADRHGGLRARISRRPARRLLRSGNGTSGPGLQLVHPRRPGLYRTGLGRDHCADDFPSVYEYTGHHPPPSLRAPLVREGYTR